MSDCSSHRNFTVIATLFIVLFVSISQAIGVSHRYSPRCALYAKQKIYCVGGQKSADVFFNDTYLLDLSSLSSGGSNTTLNDLSHNWKAVNTVNYTVEKRKTSTFVATDIVMHFFGGISNDAKLINISSSFHMDTETWETLPNYKDFQGEEKQISSSSVTYSPSPNNKIYFYGGMAQYAVNHTYQAVNTFFDTAPMLVNSAGLPTDGIGFAQSVTYDIITKSWTTTSPQAPPPSLDSQRQLSFLDKSTIYYFGGKYALKSEDYRTNYQASFSEVTTFDLNTGLWGKTSFGGQIPEPRTGATTTLLPSDDLLLYGGSPDERTVNRTLLSDFCYSLNLASKNWTRHNPPYDPTALVRRDSHTAVLVQTPESVSVFIMFGLHLTTPLDDVLILDVRYMDALRFVTTYPYIDQKDLPSNKTKISETVIEKETKLSQGTIIGISVSCAAVIIAAITGYILYYRKKKASEIARANLEAEEKSNISHQMNELYVDWDNIEKQYNHDDGNYYHENHNSSSSPYTSKDMYFQEYSSDLPPPDVAQSFTPHSESASDVNLPVQNSIATSPSSEKIGSTATTSTTGVSPIRSNSSVSTSSPQQNNIILEKPDIGIEKK